MRRRTFLKSVTAAALGAATARLPAAADSTTPVIDAHIHLFDPGRPGGVPWPKPVDAALYKPALPPRYMKLASPHHVMGAIAVECSPWLVDNFWLQGVVEQNPIMLGFIGDLEPAAPDFAATVDLLHRSPLFLGIRYGNLWNRDMGAALEKREFVDGLKLLAQAGLLLETANPNAALISAVVTASDRVPNLRIVLDHLPNAVLPDDAAARRQYDADLTELSHRPTVFVKGSEIVRRVDGQVLLDMVSYKASLDRMWELFGEDRIFFGSDWPNSDSLASYDDTFGVAASYIETRSSSAQDKYFWKNSIRVYQWKARTAGQAQLLQIAAVSR
jgi:predicted TIM-barrel fold metal-dependent hydrolase